nr:MAG TPA: hypothetical protein [Bacteriophage sp.]
MLLNLLQLLILLLILTRCGKTLMSLCQHLLNYLLLLRRQIRLFQI